MVHHLLKSVQHVDLHHIDVHFGAPPRQTAMARLDAAIGRSAHISFLDSDSFVNMFVHAYINLFL